MWASKSSAPPGRRTRSVQKQHSSSNGDGGADEDADSEVPIIIAAASSEGDQGDALPQPLLPPSAADAQVVIIDDPDDADFMMPSEGTPLLLEPVIYSSNGRQIPSTRSNGNSRDGNNDDDDENGASARHHHHDADVAKDNPPSQSLFRDAWFGFLWLAHFAALIYAWAVITPKGYTYGKTVNRTDIDAAIHDNNDDMTPEDMAKLDDFLDLAQDYLQVYPQRIFWYMVVPSAEIAVLITFLYTYCVLRTRARAHVTMALVGTVLIALVVVGFIALSISSFSGTVIVSCLILGPVVYFVYSLRPMIPFASVNLKVALTGISANCGIYFLALAFAELGFVWFLFWLYTLVGTLTYLDNECKDSSANNMTTSTAVISQALVSANDNDDGDDSAHYALGVSSTYDSSTDGIGNTAACENNQSWNFFAFLFSLYWTSNIIMNTLQVTVAGVMATWCFDKESAQWCCSSAVWSSLFRACTSSFGSISFGSLVQAFVTAIRNVIKQGQQQRSGDGRDACNGSMLGCGLDFIAQNIERALDYFNHWAYVYVGIHGYTYIESGKRVFELFKSQGWTTIVTDQLVTYVLRFTSLLMAIATGLVAIVVDRFITWSHRRGDEVEIDWDAFINEESYIFGPIEEWPILAFLIGLIVGKIVASIMVHVIKGAVNTLIVCWADAPSRMMELHPDLTQELAETWSLVLPEYIPPRRPQQQPMAAAEAVYT